MLIYARARCQEDKKDQKLVRKRLAPFRGPRSPKKKGRKARVLKEPIEKPEGEQTG